MSIEDVLLRMLAVAIAVAGVVATYFGGAPRRASASQSPGCVLPHRPGPGARIDTLVAAVRRTASVPHDREPALENSSRLAPGATTDYE